MKIKEIRSYYFAQMSAGVHALDALNKVMEVFYNFTFKNHLESIFTVDNVKTIKGQKKGFLTGIIYFAPAKLSTVNVCPMSEKAGCAKPCLYTAGQGRYSNVQAARLRKTLLYHLNPELFYAMCERDIIRLKRKADKYDYTLALRFNGTSDIAWYKTPLYQAAVKHGAIVYDYTKIVKHIEQAPAGYHYTLSYSEYNPYYAGMVKEAMVKYPSVNVAVVFRDNLPDTFLGRPVVNGDETDLRFLDDSGVIVGLKAKGKAKKDYTGFVID